MCTSYSEDATRAIFVGPASPPERRMRRLSVPNRTKINWKDFRRNFDDLGDWRAGRGTVSRGGSKGRRWRRGVCTKYGVCSAYGARCILRVDGEQRKNQGNSTEIDHGACHACAFLAVKTDTKRESEAQNAPSLASFLTVLGRPLGQRRPVLVPTSELVWSMEYAVSVRARSTRYGGVSTEYFVLEEYLSGR